MLLRLTCPKLGPLRLDGGILIHVNAIIQGHEKINYFVVNILLKKDSQIKIVKMKLDKLAFELGR
jgi:hypothetical protein